MTAWSGHSGRADSASRSLPPTSLEQAHDALGDYFAQWVSKYDTRRRIEVLVDAFLSDHMIRGKAVLDVGCGLGFFSRRLKERGADVTACDIGHNLVERVRREVGCRCETADALRLVEHFGREVFDTVVSSECIEHTRSPQRAVEQMIGVLRQGGHISLSTPNRLWQPVVRTATALRLRPYCGRENFSTWRGLRRLMRRNGVSVLREHGLHLWPFQLGFHRLSTWCDANTQFLRPLMVNICMLGRKL